MAAPKLRRKLFFVLNRKQQDDGHPNQIERVGICSKIINDWNVRLGSAGHRRFDDNSDAPLSGIRPTEGLVDRLPAR